MSLEARLKEWGNAIERADPARAKDAAVGLCRAVGEGGGPFNAQASQALMDAINKRPQLFRQPDVLPNLMRYLRGPSDARAGGAGGGAGAVLFHRLAANALARAFRDCPEWPVDFMQAFMEDALGPRAWVEDAECKLLVDNLRTAWDRKKVNSVLAEPPPGPPGALPTMGSSASGSTLDSPVPPTPPTPVLPRAPPPSRSSSSAAAMDTDSDSGEEEVLEVGVVGGGAVVSPPAPPPRSAPPPPPRPAADDDDSDSGDEEVLEVAVVGGGGLQSPPHRAAAVLPVETPLPSVWPRYQKSQEGVRQVIATMLDSRLQPQSSGPMGQAIATLTDLAASPFCRRLAMEYLERWLSTPAQSQKAKTLLAAVIREVDPLAAEDADVIAALLGLKLPVQQDKLFTESIAALVQKHPQLLQRVLRFFLTEGLAAGGEGGARYYKGLARILAHALQQQQQQQEGSSRRPPRSQWLSKSSVGRELAAMIKESILQGQSAQACQEACLATVRTLTLEQCDLLRLVGELLAFPPELFKTRPDGPPPPACAPRDYVQTLAAITTELCRFRGGIVLDLTKSINEAWKKEQKSRTMSEGEADKQRLQGLWRCRLALVKDTAEIHALVARFAVQVAEHIPVALREPEPDPEAADAASAASSSSSKRKQLKRGERALALFRRVVFLPDPAVHLDQLFHPDRQPPPDKAQRSSPEHMVSTYLGVKDATVRALLQLATTSPVRALPADALLTQVEALVFKAADFLFRREADRHGAAVSLAALLTDGQSSSSFSSSPHACVELSFPDDAIVRDLFSVARFTPPQGLEAELQLVVKLPLADASLFWRVALLLLVISGSNPSSVGRWLWHRCPTLRCLMQMVVCSQYQFPPPGAATILLPEQAWGGGSVGGGSFSTGDKAMLLADAELADEEAQAMALLKGDEGGRGGGGGGSLKKKKRKRLRMLEEEAMGNRTTRSRTKAAEAKAEQGGGKGEGGGLPRLIMLDLGMAPRKPPPDVLQQLQSLDKKFGIGARFRRSTEPDFVAAAIAGDDSTRVSRVMIESSIGWLAPAVAAEPDVTMKRLPLGCICYMLMMAYHTDTAAAGVVPTGPNKAVEGDAEAEGDAEGVRAAQAALVRLRAPLRAAVCAALMDEGSKQDKAGMALGLFLADVSHPSSKRRAAARKALESLLGDLDEEEAVAMDVAEGAEEAGLKTQRPFKAAELGGIITSKPFLAQAAREHCSWVFRLDRLPGLRDCKRPVLDALSQALQVEASHYVISYYLLALYSLCHPTTPPTPTKEAAAPQFDVSSSKAGDQRASSSPSFFSWLLCTALAGRRLVMQATADRFPLLQSLIMEEVYATLQEAASKPPPSKAAASRLWLGDRQVRLLLPGCKEDEPVLLPHALLQACVAVLSVFSAAQPPPALTAVLTTLFPPPAADGAEPSSSSSRAYGAAGATLAQALEEPALSAEDWIQLAKCACPAVSEGTSRCMPALLLCRLLLCSGLSDHCFRTALERIDGLGRSDSSGEAYRDLLSPASTASWGMARALGTRKALTRKLFRRVTAYLRLQGAATGGLSGASSSSSRFLEWLNHEVASAELDTHRDQRADRSTTTAGMLTLTTLPPASAPAATQQQQQPDSGPRQPPVPPSSVVTQMQAAAMLVMMGGQQQPQPPVELHKPTPLLPSPPPGLLLSVGQSGLEQQATKLSERWSSSVEGAEAAVREVAERLKSATASGTVQLLQSCVSELRQLLRLALRSLPAARRGARGLKRPRASSLSVDPAPSSTAMSVDQGEEERRPLPTPADVAMEVLSALQPELTRHAPYAPAPPAVLQAGLLACDLCCAFWAHASLSARCQELLWALLFTPPPSGQPARASSSPSSPRPLLRPALLSRTLRSLTPDQLDAVARRLLQQCTTPDSQDLQASLTALVTYLRHPKASPLVFEIGSSPFTASYLAKLLAPAKAHHLHAAAQQQAPSTLSLRTPSNLSPSEISALLTIVLAALAPPQLLPPRTRDFVSSSLCIQLIQRNPVLCCPVAQFLLTSIRTATATATGPSSPGTTAMDVDGMLSPPSPTSFAEALLLRLYLTFPSEVAPIFKTSRLDAKTIVAMLCRGQQEGGGGGRPARLGDNYFEKRMPEDVAQLTRLGTDTRLDSEAVSSLTETAKRHPFLLLRHLPSLTRLLEWDASPTLVKDDPSFAPFYLRKRAPPPPEAMLTASVAGGRGGFHVRFSSWGSVFNLSLWQQLLGIVGELPPKVLMAYDHPAAGRPVVLDFVQVYVRLLAAWKPEESPPTLAERVSGLLAALRKERPDVVDKFSKKRLPGAKATPADVLLKHCRKTQPGEAPS